VDPVTMIAAWGVSYLFGLYVVAGLLTAVFPRLDGSRAATGILGALGPIGLAVIVWIGLHGSLPGTGHQMWPWAGFIVRLIAWPVSLGLLMGGVAGMTAYRQVSKVWAAGEGASALIILYPAAFGCLGGVLLGMVVAIVQTVRT